MAPVEHFRGFHLLLSEIISQTYSKPRAMLNKTKKTSFAWRHPCICTLIDHGQRPIIARVAFTSLYKAFGWVFLSIYIIFFFFEAEKSNSLADCVNAVFFRLAGTFKLRGKAGESSVKKVFCCFLLGNLVVSLTCIQLCSLGCKMFHLKPIGFLKLFFTLSFLLLQGCL